MTTYFNKSNLTVNGFDIPLSDKKKAKLNVISLFSGAGGMDLGFKGDFDFLNTYYPKNSFDVIFANDIFKQAASVYELNFNHEVEKRSIIDISEKDLPNSPVDIVLGGFPCQTFSYSGNRAGLSDPRGQLYLQMIRIIQHYKPKMFVAENVDGIRNSKKNNTGKDIDKSALDIILTDFENVGYNVQYKVLNSADYGVPQKRRRVIIIGIRKDIGSNMDVYYPETTHSNEKSEKKPWLTAKDGIDDLWDKINSIDIPNHTIRDYSKAKFYPGKKMQGNNRILENQPAPTIRAEHHGNIEAHYRSKLEDETDMSGWRRLSVRECARLQSFPDSYNFITSASTAYKMIGNAVPPVMAWHIASSVFYTLFKLNQLPSNK